MIQLYLKYLFTITSLISFQSTGHIITTDEIVGTYSFKSGGCCGEDLTRKLKIQKDFKYTEILSASTFEMQGKWETIGKWSLNSDTLILIPTTVKLLPKGIAYNCITQKDSIGFSFMCKADTLVYKDKGLWTNEWSRDKSLEKKYTKK